MTATRHHSAWRRTETWLWTGPAGHLVGGALDLLAALSLHLIERARAALVRAEGPAS